MMKIKRQKKKTTAANQKQKARTSHESKTKQSIQHDESNERSTKTISKTGLTRQIQAQRLAYDHKQAPK